MCRSLSPRRQRHRGQLLIIGAALVLLLLGGGITGATYLYDSMPLVENNVAYPVAQLPPTVANAFAAAVDPDFYDSDD